MNNLQDKQIFYENDKYFDIIPELNEVDASDFNDYISKVKMKYNYEGNNCYFWEYSNNAIIVNNDSQVTGNDIFVQFTYIVSWLYSKNYLLVGSFHSCVDNVIEYIAVDKNKLITHYVLVDEKSNTIKSAKTKLQHAISRKNSVWKICLLSGLFIVGIIYGSVCIEMSEYGKY